MNTNNNRVNTAWSKSNALYAKAASLIGINYTDMMVLYALKTEGELTQKQISENFGMQKQTVNTVVKKFINQGYLQLNASQADKREKILIFTDCGKAFADSIIDPIIKIENKVYGILGEEKVKLLYETLDLFNLLFERELNGGFNNE